MLLSVSKAFGHADLFYIHVIGIKVNKNIIRTNAFNQRHRLLGSIQKMRLIAFAGFNPQAHIEVFRRLRRSVDTGCSGIKLSFGCRCNGGFSNRSIGHTRQRTCAHIAGHPSGKR